MAGFFSLLFFACLVAFVVGLFNPRRVLLGKTRDRGRVAFVYGFLATGFLVAAGSTAPPQSEEAGRVTDVEAPATRQETAADRLNEALEDLRDVTVELTQEDGVFQVSAIYQPESVWSTASYISDLSIHLHDLGSAAHGSGVPIGGITTVAMAPSVDKYGNSDVSLAFVFTIAPDDFRQINWDGITYDQVLELAQVQATSFGQRTAAEYCAEITNLKRTPRFCRGVYSG